MPPENSADHEDREFCEGSRAYDAGCVRPTPYPEEPDREDGDEMWIAPLRLWYYGWTTARRTTGLCGRV